jgi:hypothetical protein
MRTTHTHARDIQAVAALRDMHNDMLAPAVLAESMAAAAGGE